MAGLKQSKRVSWAPDVKLCQVRLFLSEDSPSQSGSGFQDHLQAKASWLQHSRELNVDESLPPGFESPLISYQSNKWISQIPLVKWKTPPKFFLNQEWLVVAGEESGEVGLQNQRQIGVFEAIYPRLSSIPPNPILFDVQDSHCDDAPAPPIPLIAIEEDDPLDERDSQAALRTSSLAQHEEVTKSSADVRTPSTSILSAADISAGNMDSGAPNIPNSEKPLVGLIHGVEPDVMAAASAAFTALIRSSEEGSLIDRDLLIKILSSPGLVERLMAESGMPKQHAPPVQPVVPPAPIAPVSFGAPSPAPQLAQFRPPQSAVLRPPASLQPTSRGIQIAANPPPVSGAPVKDMSYFKTLIQQHGGDKPEVTDPSHAPPLPDGHRRFPSGEAVGGSNADQGIHGSVHKGGDPKSKIPKPCIYFNSPRGCRRGADCLFVHDGSLPQTIERQSSKKIKLDKEGHRKSRLTF